MKASLKLIAAMSLILFIVSCKDDEKPVDPILGVWELDDVSLSVSDSEYAYLQYNKENDLFGESSYTIEFKGDFTYERILEDVPLSNNTLDNIEEEGEWELDGDELDFDSDEQEINGLNYSFTVASKTTSKLTLTYSEIQRAFPQSKVTDWFADGTLDNEGRWTVTEDQLDSLVANFSQPVDFNYKLDFDKR